MAEADAGNATASEDTEEAEEQKEDDDRYFDEHDYGTSEHRDDQAKSVKVNWDLDATR